MYHDKIEPSLRAPARPNPHGMQYFVTQVSVQPKRERAVEVKITIVITPARRPIKLCQPCGYVGMSVI